MTQSTRPLSEELARAVATLASRLREMGQALSRTAAAVTHQLEEAVTPLVQRLPRVPDDLRKIQSYLGDIGWYLSGSAPIGTAAQLARMIDQEQHDKVETFMRELARSRVNHVERDLCQRWAARSPIFRDAFKALHDGMYTVSIPTMLAQADGIASEILQLTGTNSIFSKRTDAKQALQDRLPRPDDAIESLLLDLDLPDDVIESLLLDSVTAILLQALTSPTSVAQRTDIRDEKRAQDPRYGPLNRHGVLHGIDTDYATEPNALRSVMLLDYLVWVKESLDAHAGPGSDLDT